MIHNSQKIVCANEPETTALAHLIAPLLKGGDYVSLEGDLGAGKTFFARALAASFGITESVTSPTFVLQKSYSVASHPSIKRLAHYDFYRIFDYEELLDIGFEDHDTETLVFAEWGDMFISDFPRQPVRIKFNTHYNDSRLIEVSGLILPGAP